MQGWHVLLLRGRNRVVDTAGGDSFMGSPGDAVFFGWAVLRTDQQHGQHLVQKDGRFSHSFLENLLELTR